MRCEHRLEVLDPAAELGVPVEHRLLGRLQHAVQAAQHGQRQDDLAVLGLLVVAPQQVGDRPDERGVVAHVLGSCSGHDLLKVGGGAILTRARDGASRLDESDKAARRHVRRLLVGPSSSFPTPEPAAHRP